MAQQALTFWMAKTTEAQRSATYRAAQTDAPRAVSRKVRFETVKAQLAELATEATSWLESRTATYEESAQGSEKMDELEAYRDSLQAAMDELDSMDCPAFRFRSTEV